jgi:redox-sensitive bicupin YhaK (pirin superfamily)
MTNALISDKPGVRIDRLGPVVKGLPHKIGSSFAATHFSDDMFGDRMDPLLMVDHFVMTAPTFDPHLHAGISAVTAMFEDSDGAFLNRDTLGHNVALKPGDLYWLAAASGAVHEEKPDHGARTHALQIFVNLPGRLKMQPARALHVEASDIPVLAGDKMRVRIVLGRSGDTAGAQGTPEEMTLLDGFLEAGGNFTHPLPEGRQAWIYAVSGNLLLRIEGEQLTLDAGSATTIASGSEIDIELSSEAGAHFVLLAGRPIREKFVKHGPLVMSTTDDVRTTIARYAEGCFGKIAN